MSRFNHLIMAKEDIMNPKPKAPKPIFANIPDQLTRLNQWVLWRYSLRDGKWNKVPYQPNGNNAKSNAPSTWNPFLTVCDAYYTGNFDGIMFAFSDKDNFVGVDFDDIIQPSGELKPWAKPLVESIESYGEISPSQLGIKYFLIGEWGAGRNQKVDDSAIEIYSKSRFFTVTGNRYDTAGNTIVESQHIIDKIAELYFPPKPSPPKRQPQAWNTNNRTADEVLRLLRRAKNATTFERLFRGDIQHGSQSESDLALCSMIAFYTQDPEVIDVIFRQSGLMRDKWDQKHYGDGRTYGQGTIDKALAIQTTQYSGSNKKPFPSITNRHRNHTPPQTAP